MSVLPISPVSNEIIYQTCGNISPEPESMDTQEMTMIDKFESNSQSNTQTLEMSVFPFSTLSLTPLLESSNPCSDTGPLNMSVLPNFSVSNEELIDQIYGDLSPEPESMDTQEMPRMDKFESNSQSNTQTLEMSVFPFSTLSNEEISTHFGNIMHHEQIRRMNMKISKLQQKQNSVLRDEAIKAVLFSTLQLQKEKDVCLQTEKELKETIVDLKKKCEIQQKIIQRNIHKDKQDKETMESKMEELTEEITKLSENNKENEIEITKLKARNSLLQCFSELHFHNFSKVSDVKESLQMKYDKLQETAKNMKSEVQWEIKEMKQKCIADVNEMRYKNNMLLKEIQKHQQKCKAQKTIINNVTKKSNLIKKEGLTKQKKEMTKLKAKLLKANATIDNLQSENKFKDMTKELENLKQKCQEQEKTIDKKTWENIEQKGAHATEIGNLYGKFLAASVQRENLLSENYNLLNQVTNLKQTVELCKCMEKDKEISDLKSLTASLKTACTYVGHLYLQLAIQNKS